MRTIYSTLAPEWVDTNLRIVLMARIAMSACRAVASVVTALYLAAIGFSGLKIGVLFVCVTVASAVMSTAIGLVSDRVGRKVFLVVVPLIAAGAALVYTESRATEVLFVCAALGSFGRGSGAGAGSVGPYLPAESALVAEIVPADQRSAAFARISFASSLGALGGGLLAQLVHAGSHMSAAEATTAYRPAFLAAAILAAVAGGLAMFIREPANRRPARGPAPGRRIRWPRRSWPALWRFWCTNATNGFGIGLLGPFVSYWLHRRYGASPGSIGILFAIINLGSLASTLTAAPVARRLGMIRAISAVRALGGILLIPMVLAPTFWIAGAVYFVRMMIQRVGLPLRQSLTQHLAHPDERSSVAALSSLPAQATMAGSQVLAGYLFDEVSLSAPFELAALFQCANAVVYELAFSWRPPPAAPGSTTSTVCTY